MQARAGHRENRENSRWPGLNVACVAWCSDKIVWSLIAWPGPGALRRLHVKPRLPNGASGTGNGALIKQPGLSVVCVARCSDKIVWSKYGPVL